ncbi:LuxR C-terminal-related transcriptional regulator [Luteococcus sp. Sow4_B9]|uniref:helix-turn-helix transcriptional regulator n=1 Tax=Luteococcus sp. Sow4_B9 TaxID=3438792 RepID=UPI003F9E3C89
MGPSSLLPTRRRDLEALVELTSAASGSRVVAVQWDAGVETGPLLRELTAQLPLDPARIHLLTGLSWQSSTPGALLRGIPWSERGAEGLLASVTPSGLDGPDLAVIVDQAQHADVDSLRALVECAHTAHGLRVLLIIGLEEQGPAMAARPAAERALLHEVVRSAHDRHRLPALGIEDVVEIAGRQGLALLPGVAARVLDHCGGHDEEVEETIRLLADQPHLARQRSMPVPPSLRNRTEVTLATLSDEAVGLLQAVAVLEVCRPGLPVQVSEAGRVAGVQAEGRAVDRTSALVDETRSTGLLRVVDPGSRTVVLASPSVRVCLLEAMGIAGQRGLHARAARLQDDPETQLRHEWYADPRADRGLAEGFQRLAAQRARRGEWMASAHLLELAAEATDDPVRSADLFVEAADAVVGAGDLTLLGARIAQLETVRETALREACLGYIGCLTGRPSTAGARLQRARELVNPQRNPEVARKVAERQVLHALARCRAEELLEWHQRARILRPDGDPEDRYCEAEAISGVAQAALEGPELALARLDGLLAEVPEGAMGQRLRLARGWVLLAAGDHLAARDELERAAAGAGVGSSFRVTSWATAWLARVQLETGEWQRAAATAARGADEARRHGLYLLVPLLEWTAAEVAALRGDWEQAERSLQAGRADASHYEIMRAPAMLARAAVAREREDPRAVLEALAPFDQSWARGWVSAPGFWPWAEMRADALLLMGRREEAEALVTAHEERAVAQGHRLQIARMAGLRARCLLLDGRVDEARAAHARALEVLEELPLPLDRARLHAGWAGALRRSGRRTEAEAALTLSRQVRQSLGLGGLVEAADRVAVSEEEPGRAARPVLTQKELSVARLVADGMTNREVAGQLFISVKTVQYHLTAVYAKLGIRSRAELAARGLADLAS